VKMVRQYRSYSNGADVPFTASWDAVFALFTGYSTPKKTNVFFGQPPCPLLYLSLALDSNESFVLLLQE
jgi:hypothetical protein